MNLYSVQTPCNTHKPWKNRDWVYQGYAHKCRKLWIKQSSLHTAALSKVLIPQLVSSKGAVHGTSLCSRSRWDAPASVTCLILISSVWQVGFTLCNFCTSRWVFKTPPLFTLFSLSVSQKDQQRKKSEENLYFKYLYAMIWNNASVSGFLKCV